MAAKVVPARGMRDFLPQEKRRRERVLAIIRDAFTAHGFAEIETPVVEDASRLSAGLGGDNEKLAFGIQKRGLTIEDVRGAQRVEDLVDLGLRFDLTVPLARFIASNRGQLPGVFRAIQIAPVWRAERPQAGRYRQFVQCDIDIAGEEGLVAELELLAATGDALARLGLPEAYIRINDRRLLQAVLDAAGVLEGQREAALITIDKLDKIGREGVTEELTQAGVDAARLFAVLDALAAGEAPGIPAEALADVQALLAADVGVRLAFDPTLVRGMGYYTGPIFEIAHPELPYSIGGGGRYDGMIGRFSGTDMPAVGISLGFERLVDLVQLPDMHETVIGLLVEKGTPAEVLVAVKRALVAEGARVLVAKRPKNVHGALTSLAEQGADVFAHVSPDTTRETLLLKPLAG